mmetsp:Transcript_100598/g.173790  ORF Transcript_100598/g.173790 Transcript_100598/m.173790 type:complete len:244 (-) Transcript_100598:1697-2428(-)
MNDLEGTSCGANRHTLLIVRDHAPLDRGPLIKLGRTLGVRVCGGQQGEADATQMVVECGHLPTEHGQRPFDVRHGHLHPVLDALLLLLLLLLLIVLEELLVLLDHVLPHVLEVTPQVLVLMQELVGANVGDLPEVERRVLDHDATHAVGVVILGRPVQFHGDHLRFLVLQRLLVPVDLLHDVGQHVIGLSAAHAPAEPRLQLGPLHCPLAALGGTCDLDVQRGVLLLPLDLGEPFAEDGNDEV